MTIKNFDSVQQMINEFTWIEPHGGLILSEVYRGRRKFIVVFAYQEKEAWFFDATYCTIGLKDFQLTVKDWFKKRRDYYAYWRKEAECGKKDLDGYCKFVMVDLD